jgi:hypothetical protein
MVVFLRIQTINISLISGMFALYPDIRILRRGLWVISGAGRRDLSGLFLFFR